ncbi:MAG: RidA family protein, partial [Planctomycetota bacterium]
MLSATRTWLLLLAIHIGPLLTTATCLDAEEAPAIVGDSDPAIRRLKMPLEASKVPAVAGSQESPGQAAAVIVNSAPLVHTAQMLPLLTDHESATAATVVQGGASAQIARVYERLDQVLRGVGSSTPQIVKLNVYVANAAVAATVRDDLAKRFRSAPPAVCFVETALPLPDALVAVDAVAVATAPAAVNQAANAVSAAVTPAGPRVYVAGQAEKGDLRTATRKTLESLEATLKFLRLDWSDVAQVKSFVTPMAAVRDADDETRRFFAARNATVPPLVWVEWQSGLPIEMERVAAAGRGEP